MSKTVIPMLLLAGLATAAPAFSQTPSTNAPSGGTVEQNSATPPANQKGATVQPRGGSSSNTPKMGEPTADMPAKNGTPGKTTVPTRQSQPQH
jgi:hypothetical protein